MPTGLGRRSPGLLKRARGHGPRGGGGLPCQGGRTRELSGRGRPCPHGGCLPPGVGAHTAKARTGRVHGGPERRRQTGADIDG